eukprot:gene9445-10435_t
MDKDCQDMSERQPLVDFLREHADFILNVVAPLVWVALFVHVMDREMVLSTWYMPFLGFAAAVLSNSVPIGGGIVYIPALWLLGANISLGASFSLAVMPLGNGLLGFLRWLRKDPSVFVWNSFLFTVVPSWIGSFMAIILLPKPHVWAVRLGFGLLCFLLGALVLAAVYRGGIKEALTLESFFTHPKVATRPHPSPHHSVEDEIGFSEDEEDRGGDQNELDGEIRNVVSQSVVDWSTVVLVSFLAGALLVPHIAVGPALTTYCLLALMGYSEQQAMVTGIVTGGWVCILPFLLNVFVFENVPVALWLMVLPGVFLGARLAPELVSTLGRERVMTGFSAFLFASALLFWIHP